ncbi:hypothetical protein [Escherichia coli]|uniref:hypothetical protein n=1 Tax=Escherichia coli TaxID=562 RepID=UPI0020230C3E|nr:hypothetical protein [Escherichia coli]
MKDFKLTNEQPARCHVCGIKSKDVFSLAEDGQKENALLCMPVARTPGEMKLETQTGLLLKKYKPKTLQPVVSFNCKSGKVNGRFLP